jgi:S-DNA-T family DNA segregation ATPase FtsK/SpoIIIE
MTSQMTSTELIGAVAARYLRDKTTGSADEGTARFLIDCLSPEQTAAIARAILADPTMASRFDIKLPEHFVAGLGLPSDVLTEERATYYRHAECSRPALLLANTGDDEQQSLTELVPIGAPQLMDHPELWVGVASAGLVLTEEHRLWWEKALRGLQDQQFVPIERFADYVLQTRTEVDLSGLGIVKALGAALPTLQLPRDTNYFEVVKTRTHTSKWKAAFGTAQAKRAPYLRKQNPAGIGLNEDDLRKAFDTVHESIPVECHQVVEEFITAPSGWNPSAAALADCEWEWVKPLFDGMQRQQYSLGRATKEFYDDRDASLLRDEERAYIDRLIARKTTQADDEDKDFYEAHRNELREERKLKSVWDKFIYGTPRETFDFLAGLVTCLESLFGQESPSARRKLVISCESRSKKDFRDLNAEAGIYFERRYKGLRGLLGTQVSWEVGDLFRFSELVDEWRSAKKDLNRSAAKAALQLKFVVRLQVELLNGSEETYFAQMIWRYNPQWVTSSFADDWGRLSAHPLVRCVAHRDPVRGGSIDLANIQTFQPAYRLDRGSFVPAYKPANDLGKTWPTDLATATADGLVTEADGTALRECFETFRDRYTDAVQGWVAEGAACDALHTQAEAYGTLLEGVCRNARGDKNRQRLLRPLMQIGTVAIEGGTPATVVAPWHPLRLAAMARKTRMVADLIRHLLSTTEVNFGDPRLFFNDYRELLQHPFYPEVVLGWQESKPELLALADTVGEYSLHEPPLVKPGMADATSENPAEGARQVLELVQRYLALHPHEQSNLSVVLYNSDSARLPTAVVDKIGTLHADEEEMRCQIVLRHRDPERLRDLYEEIVEARDDPDAFNASEGTRDFMARLRISIMADQAPAPNPKDGCPVDIAFSQDVIARHAHVEWYPQGARPMLPEKLVPSRWSRRRPAARDDLRSVVFLACPVQTREGWAYLSALTTFLRGDWDGNEAQRLLPARQLNFQEPETAQIFKETHDLANWVVNFDELLDRRQLMNQGVRVIRYKQFATQGRNLIVSSNARLGLLHSMVLHRLRDLNLDLDAADHTRLAERFIHDANDVSGDIVLRAAKRGRNASELMGIVLSRFLIRHEMGVNRHFGWYFLDDYAGWLGQREQQIADMLALTPERTPDGKLRLAAVVTEAKYIDALSLAAKRKESQNQLRQTVIRVREAVFGSPHRLDRELWLARLSDLLLDGVQFPASANLDLDGWRRAIRDGDCELHVRGYSHVFVPSPSDSEDCSDFVAVSGLDDSFQEVFGRPRVRELVLRYHRDEDPTAVRQADADPRVWTDRDYLPPSNRVVMRPDDEGGSAAILSGSTPKHQSGGAPPMQVGSIHPGSPDASTVPTVEATSGARWAYPGIQGLLGKEGTASSSADAETWLRQTEVRMRGALQQFQLQSKLVASVLTPNAALLKFAGSANLTVDQVLKRRLEFLTTHGLNLISVQPEPGLVAISVERPERQVVHLRELWGRWQPDSVGGNQDLLIGVREDDGEVLVLSPGKEHAPHTLIAGATGSGKSVLMQNIILAIAATNTPAEARLVLIDPKQGVDYFSFEALPHLDGGIIDTQEAALERINALVEEMDARYRKLREARAANVRLFNQRVSADEKLPVIWLIHDEFAEWMLVEEYRQNVTAAVARLGVKARAAGIHLVFAAQRPEANVMPMQLRANLGNRLILRVDSEGTSEIALGDRGAERLLGRGHLVAKLEGSYGLTYAQVPFAPAEYIDRLVGTIRQDAAFEIAAAT